MTLEFTQRTGSDNPLDGVGFEKKSTPAFVDIDNDGDLDIFYTNSGIGLQSGLMWQENLLFSSIDTIVSLPQTSVLSESVLYPNPASDLLMLRLDEAIFPSEIEVEIFTLTGQKVANFEGQSSYDISHLDEGIYIVEISKAGKVFHLQKIIVFEE